jgi:hypothetical protein
MKKFTNPLDNIHIASPCKADWNAMTGDERKRHCAECKLNVYNLSEMTRTEAENFLINSEGRVCVRFYRRADGSVITQNCPVGWQAFKRRVSKMTAAFASLVFGVASGLGLTALFTPKEDSKNISTIRSSAATTIFNTLKPIPKDEIEDYAVMGDVMPVNGEPINLNDVRREIKDKQKR